MSVGLFGEQKRKIDFGNRERSFSVGTDEWITPKWIIDALGPFDLDPCSAIDMPWKTANRCFTETDNGLLQQWDGFIWLNPPYGRETSRWMARLAEHNNGIALIFARTETEMFFQYVWGRATSLAFLKGRINFARKDGSTPNGKGKGGGGPGAPSVLVAYGNLADSRLKLFGANNAVVTGWHIR